MPAVACVACQRLSAGRFGGDQTGAVPVSGGIRAAGSMKPRRHSCFLDVAGIDLPHPPGLGREQHYEPTLSKVGQCVHESVDEVAVILAPPQDHCVDDVAVFLVLELVSTDLLYRQT